MSKYVRRPDGRLEKVVTEGRGSMVPALEPFNGTQIADAIQRRAKMLKHAAYVVVREFPKEEEVGRLIAKLARTQAERQSMAAIARQCGLALAEAVVQVAMAQAPRHATTEELEQLIIEEVAIARVLEIVELELIEYAEHTRKGVLQ